MTLYERSNYVNPMMEYIVNRELVEYDMVEAGYNLLKEYPICSPEIMNKLDNMDKQRRKVVIGLLQRDDRQFNIKFQQLFVEARKLFFEHNNLDESNVVSIKRDAIFTTKICHKCVFGHIHFKNKNQYSSFFKFDDLEFYYNETSLTVKGLGKIKYKYHEPYMLSILHTLFQCIEHNDMVRGRQILSDFIMYYRTRQLHVGYYREMNRSSLFRLHDKLNYQSIGAESINPEDLNIVDISYNYNAYLVPLIALLI